MRADRGAIAGVMDMIGAIPHYAMYIAKISLDVFEQVDPL